MNARHKRWDDLMAQNKGQIDVALAQQFLADHWDSYQNKQQANERTLCGHVEDSPRGMPEWDRPPYYPDGAVSGKAADSTMTKNMEFMARAGHPCGEDFIADKFLASHSEYDWMKPRAEGHEGQSLGGVQVGREGEHGAVIPSCVLRTQPDLALSN